MDKWAGVWSQKSSQDEVQSVTGQKDVSDFPVKWKHFDIKVELDRVKLSSVTQQECNSASFWIMVKMLLYNVVKHKNVFKFEFSFIYFVHKAPIYKINHLGGLYENITHKIWMLSF